MGVYRWRARDTKGMKFCGELRAGGEKEVAEFIQANYGYVTGIKEVRKRKLFIKRKIRGRTKLNDSARESFFRQLSTLLKSGLPLLKGLDLIRQKSTGPMLEVTKSMILSLTEGRSLAEAMRVPKGAFTQTTLKIVEAGENSGSLNVLLDDLADYYRGENKLRSFLCNACIYPFFVIVLTICTFIFFAVKVLPVFLSLYSSLGVKQTAFLVTVRSVSEILSCYRWEVTCVFLFFLGLLYRQRGQIKEGCLRLPVLHDCYLKMMEQRYCRILSIMLTSGMAVPFALTAAAEALQSREMMQKSLMASNAVIRGTSISQAIALNGELFSDTSIEFISIGEESGSLPEMLWEASLVADDELQTRLKALKVMVEPILLLLVSLLVGCVLFSVASPMVGIISGMPEYF